VDQAEAEQALKIIRNVIQSTREDLVAHNWGLIWMVHAFTNLAAFASIGLLIERPGLPVYWYLAPLAVVAAVDLIIERLLASKDTGVRSFVELQMHGIWITFIVFSAFAVIVLYLAGAPPPLLGPILAMTSGIGFAMMGVVFHRRFFAFALLFLGVMLVAPLLREWQWLAIGLAWWSALFIPGAIMHRERRHRTRDETAAAIL
jgi:hypothetical protein